MKKIELFGLQTIPQINQGDNLAEIIVSCADSEIGGLKNNDIVVLTSKIVSKAQGRMRKLDEVIPGKRAQFISRKTGKDARWLQMIFDEGHKIAAIMPQPSWNLPSVRFRKTPITHPKPTISP